MTTVSGIPVPGILTVNHTTPYLTLLPIPGVLVVLKAEMEGLSLRVGLRKKG